MLRHQDSIKKVFKQMDQNLPLGHVVVLNANTSSYSVLNLNNLIGFLSIN